MPRKRPETKDLLGDTMEELLKAELDEHLDYEYGEKPLSLNTRNSTSKKQLDHHMEI